MAELHNISYMVCCIVNEIVGCRELVSIRRDVYETLDTCPVMILNKHMTSGSRREGLEMAGSDVDIMFWYTNTHVVFDSTQSCYYNTATDTLILAEHDITRPGFVLLRILHQSLTIQTLLINQACIPLQTGTYISSSKYKQFHHQFYTGSPFNFSFHGPCSSGFMNDLEWDVVHCFASPNWPSQAFSWLQRCQQQRWPRPSVLRDIIHSGCHLVPIGAKQSPYENVEWRLSFSKAEQKLINSFNHYQFLVYGLLKLFLKEVLNSGIPENQKLLCSYFMKTALFWHIQDNISTQWSAENLLHCFWNCFKLLVKWVFCQYCPNFFIPENNMFFPNITGRNQQLLSQLLGLYNEGVVCLLRCPSINIQLTSAICHLQIAQNLRYELHISYIKRDKIFQRVFRQLVDSSSYAGISNKEKCALFIKEFKSSITQARRFIFYRCIIQQLQLISLSHQMTAIHGRRNSEIYRLKKQSLNLLKRTSKLGFITDVLYIAMYHYTDGRYIEALRLLHEVKSKLDRPYVTYGITSPFIYLQAMHGKSMLTKTKEAFADHIMIPYYANISELRLELRVLEQRNNGFRCKPLIVSPFVFLHFLTFLCHQHLHCIQQRQQSLDALHTLVHNDDGRYITDYKYTAWALLGMCYQISQNPQEALQCYRKSLTFNDNLVQKAIYYRIQSLKRELALSNITELPLD